MVSEHKLKLQNPSRRIMLFGFVTMIIMVCLLAGISFYLFDSSLRHLKKVAESNEIYLATVNHMHTAARERILSLYKMVTTDDPFERDRFWMGYNSYGTEFIINRNNLLNLPISDDFRTLLKDQNKYTYPLGKIQNQIADLVNSGKLEEAKTLLLNQAGPQQNKMLNYFRQHQQEIEKQYFQALNKTAQLNNYAKFFSLLIASAIILVLYLLSRNIFLKVTNTESRLMEEKERALVTLHSIADGVLLLDRQGNIKEMNSVAESLLAVKFKDIRDKHINDIVNLYREPDKNTPIPILKTDAISERSLKSEGWVMLCNNNNDCLAIGYSISPVNIQGKLVGLVCVIHDISAIHQLAKQLDYQANHDELTGINNRRQFTSLLNQEIKETQRYNKANAWLCFIDLDFFKSINDTCGHLAGDEFLKQIAKTIQKSVRDSDHTARIGGDEFAAIIRYAETIQEATEVAERIRTSLSHMEFTWKNNSFKVSASLGLVYLADCESIDDALNKADKACYHAKQEGRNQLSVFDLKHN